MQNSEIKLFLIFINFALHVVAVAQSNRNIKTFYLAQYVEDSDAATLAAYRQLVAYQLLYIALGNIPIFIYTDYVLI